MERKLHTPPMLTPRGSIDGGTDKRAPKKVAPQRPAPSTAADDVERMFNEGPFMTVMRDSLMRGDRHGVQMVQEAMAEEGQELTPEQLERVGAKALIYRMSQTDYLDDTFAMLESVGVDLGAVLRRPDVQTRAREVINIELAQRDPKTVIAKADALQMPEEVLLDVAAGWVKHLATEQMNFGKDMGILRALGDRAEALFARRDIRMAGEKHAKILEKQGGEGPRVAKQVRAFYRLDR